MGGCGGCCGWRDGCAVRRWDEMGWCAFMSLIELLWSEVQVIEDGKVEV
jgi:hypothetical protein